MKTPETVIEEKENFLAEIITSFVFGIVLLSFTLFGIIYWLNPKILFFLSKNPEFILDKIIMPVVIVILFLLAIIAFIVAFRFLGSYRKNRSKLFTTLQEEMKKD